MDLATLAAFALAFLAFAASPGPDNLAIVARTAAHGAASGIAYGLGTTAGVLAFLWLAASGLTLVAAQMGGVMLALRYAGAAYLVVAGIRLWIAPARAVEVRRGARRGLLGTFATGLALNLGNPKMPLFALALLPGVIGPATGAREVAALAGVILAVEALVIGGHVLLAHRARRLLAEPRRVRAVNRAAGGAMVAAGVAAAAVR